MCEKRAFRPGASLGLSKDQEKAPHRSRFTLKHADDNPLWLAITVEISLQGKGESVVLNALSGVAGRCRQVGCAEH